MPSICHSLTQFLLDFEFLIQHLSHFTSNVKNNRDLRQYLFSIFSLQMGNLVIRREESCLRSHHKLRHKWEKDHEHFYISSRSRPQFLHFLPGKVYLPKEASKGNILWCNHLGVNSGISDPKDGGYFQAVGLGTECSLSNSFSQMGANSFYDQS